MHVQIRQRRFGQQTTPLAATALYCKLPPLLIPPPPNSSWTNMRTSLRRSCNACAKAKHSCDLGTPKCSRCVKRKVTCIYANAPLSSSTSSTSTPEPSGCGRSVDKSETKRPLLKSRDGSSDNSMDLLRPPDTSFDPFDSYPSTRLPRVHVQRLIQHCKAILTMHIPTTL